MELAPVHRLGIARLDTPLDRIAPGLPEWMKAGGECDPGNNHGSEWTCMIMSVYL